MNSAASSWVAKLPSRVQEAVTPTVQGCSSCFALRHVGQAVQVDVLRLAKGRKAQFLGPRVGVPDCFCDLVFT
jgi:hypothetical protein